MSSILKAGKQINHPEYGFGILDKELSRLENGNRQYEWLVYFGGCLYIPIPQNDVQKYLISD